MSRTTRCLAVAVTALVGACADEPTSPHAGHASATLSALAFDPNAYTPTVLQVDEPTDMNDAGHVVGRRTGDVGPYLQLGAVLRRLISPGGAIATTPKAINNRGNVVAEVSKPNYVVRAAYWDNYQAAPIELPSLGGRSDTPEDMNDSGYVVGYSATNATSWRAFRWRAGLTVTDISGSPRDTWATGISNQGTVSGYTSVNAAHFPFAIFGGAGIVLSSRRSQQGIGVTPGGSAILSGGETWASTGQLARPGPGGTFKLTDISALGRVAGHLAPVINKVVVTTTYTSFNGVGTTLRYPGETSSRAVAVNACGSVLAAVDVNGVKKGVLWTKATCDVGAPTF